MIAVPITLEQLIATVEQLSPSDRARVAKALIQMELQSGLTAPMKELYSPKPGEEVIDSDIEKELPTENVTDLVTALDRRFAHFTDIQLPEIPRDAIRQVPTLEE